MEKELKSVREVRGDLQQTLDCEKMSVARLESELSHLEALRDECYQLQIKCEQLSHQRIVQEEALSELGSHLSLLVTPISPNLQQESTRIVWLA